MFRRIRFSSLRNRRPVRPLLALALLALGWALAGQDVPRYPSPVDLAVSPDGQRLYVVCEGTDELLAVDTAAQSIAGRVKVGRVPQGIALSPGGQRIYVTNSWSDTVTEIDAASLGVLRTLPAGFEPHGIAAGNGSLFVANRIGSDVSAIDLSTAQDARHLPAGRGASYVAASPGGQRVYVTHIYPNPGPFRSQPESEITEIDTEHQVVVSRTRLHNAAGIFHVAISRDGRLGLAAQLRPKNLIPLAHVAHGWAFGDSLAVFGEDIGDAVQLPLDELDRYFSLPFGVAIAPDKSKAYLSASGSNEVAILDLPRLVEAARSPGRAALANDLSASAAYVLARIPVGRNPKGIALSPDGGKLYVANRLDDTVSVLDTAKGRIAATIPLGGAATLTAERRGERLFYSSRYAFQGQFGCANCHLDATIDGLSWDLEPDGFGVDIVDNRSLKSLPAGTIRLTWRTW